MRFGASAVKCRSSLLSAGSLAGSAWCRETELLAFPSRRHVDVVRELHSTFILTGARASCRGLVVSLFAAGECPDSLLLGADQLHKIPVGITEHGQI